MGSTRLYAEALKQFKNDIVLRGKDDDIELLSAFLLDGRIATPRDVKKAAAELATDADSKYDGIRIGKLELVPKKWIDNIMGNIDTIVTVGDFAAKKAPESVGMAWFAISLTLGAIRNNYNLYAIFGQGLTDITEVMIIVTHYDRLYDERDKPNFKVSDLVDKLFRDTVAAYVAVLDFALSVKKHMSAKSFEKVKHVFKDFFNAQAPKFQTKLSSIASLKDKIIESSNGAFQDKTMQQFGSLQEAIIRVREHQSESHQLQLEQREMLAAIGNDLRQWRDSVRRKTPWELLLEEFAANQKKLSPMPGSRPLIEGLLSKRHPDTGSWIFEHECYQNWVKSDRISTFCILGGVGSGKSTMLALIVQRIESETVPGMSFVNYVSCTENEGAQISSASGSMLTRVYNTLLYQIYELAIRDNSKLSILEDCNAVFRSPKQNEAGAKGGAQLTDFVEAMERLVLTLQRNTTLVIDAVGTLADDEQADLHKTLSKFAKRRNRPYRISVLIGAHTNSTFAQHEPDLSRRIDLGQNNNYRADMEICLNTYLLALPGWSEHEKQLAKEAVLAKAGSNFRYLNSVAVPFLQQPFKRPITTHLTRLPDSMNESFDRALLTMPPNYLELLRLSVTWCLLSPRIVTVKEIVETFAGTYTMNEFDEKIDSMKIEREYDPEATPVEIQQMGAASGPFLILERTTHNQTLVKLQDTRQIRDYCINGTKAKATFEHESNHVCEQCKLKIRGTSSLDIEPRIAHYEIALAQLKHLNSPLFQARFGLLDELDAQESENQVVEPAHPADTSSTEEQTIQSQNDTAGETVQKDDLLQDTGEPVLEDKVTPVDPVNNDARLDEISDLELVESDDEDHDNNDGAKRISAATGQTEIPIYTRESRLRCEIIDWPYHLKEAERLWPVDERSDSTIWHNLNKQVQTELHKFSSNRTVFMNWQRLWQIHDICWDWKTPICLAATLGLYTWTEHLLDTGANVNEISGPYNVAQSSGELAGAHQNVSLLHLLLRKGADFSRSDQKNAPALHVWLDNYGWEHPVIEAFVEHQVDFDLRNQYKRTGLHVFAWRSSDVKSLHLIMNGLFKRPDINAQDQNGQTPLHILLWRRKIPLDLLKAFLQVENIKVNIDDQWSRQPLSLASEWGSTETVKELLEAGADIHDTSHGGHTALHEAANNGHLECMNVLLDAGIALDQLDDYGYTPLQWAAWKGQLPAVQLLISKGSDINSADSHNRNPLFNALIGTNDAQGTAMFLFTKMKQARFLATQINRVSTGGRTSLRQAAARGFPDVLKELLEYVFASTDTSSRITINQGNNGLKRTPLHCAAMCGSSECVRLLLEYGADSNVRDRDGKTPLLLAQDAWARRNERAFEDVILLLIDAEREAAVRNIELPSIAAANDSVRILRKLNGLRADLNRFDSLGWTPLAHAKHSGSKAAEKFLKHEVSWGSTLPSRWICTPDIAAIDDTGLRITCGTQDEVCIASDKPLPFDVERFYYEVAIDTIEKPCTFAIGFCTLGVSAHVFPGWTAKGKASSAMSWAYHGDDGCLYHKSPQMAEIRTGKLFGPGDVVGCGVDLASRKMWFTKNGKKLSDVFDDVKGRLFPVIGLRDSVSLRTNFGREQFLWKDEERTNEFHTETQ